MEDSKQEQNVKGNGKILVMDDEEMVLEVAEDMLQYLGYEVGFARTGHEAVQAYQEALHAENPFEAVILDLTVPGGMGAKETIQQLQQLDPKVKVIVSSGYSSDPVMVDYREYGFWGMVSKPYQIAELSNVLKGIG